MRVTKSKQYSKKARSPKMSESQKMYAVILAGGVGSRFWPLSRELEPKQFLRLKGKSSLLQETINRTSVVIRPSHTYIISNKKYKYQILNQIKRFRIPEKNIILEPSGKNTAPAIGFAARVIAARDPEASMVVLPADHHIEHAERLIKLFKTAHHVSQHGHLVTIGIVPAMPHTGYGYIKVKSKELRLPGIPARSQVCAVERFVEKPDKKRAETYFKNKKYLWNSGMFIWKARVILNEICEHLPALAKQLEKLDSSGVIDEAIWNKMKSISIDYGILEQSKKVAVLPAKNIGWSDLGSWAALSKIYPKDKAGNVIKADHMDIDSRGISVFADTHFVATIGLKDVVIVDTEDALLVCDKARTEEVKDIVSKIKLDKRLEYFAHKTVKRPWGNYAVINMGNAFKVKLVHIDPHKRLSLQKHSHRSEHWVVVEGKAKVTTGTMSCIVQENESAYIPKGKKHRLENPTDGSLKIIEVQCGEYLEEDDIERFDDDFDR